MSRNTSNNPFVYIEAAYSAMQAAILFYDGLRTRSRINENILAQMEGIRDAIRNAIIYRTSQSQTPLSTTVNNLVAPIQQLTSVLVGSYSDDTTDELVKYLSNAETWLQVARSMSVNAQTYNNGYNY